MKANQTFVEVSLFRYLHEHDLWHRIDNVWQAQLVPSLALVRPKAGGIEPCFVVKTLENLILAWPAELVELKLRRPKLDVKYLEEQLRRAAIFEESFSPAKLASSIERLLAAVD